MKTKLNELKNIWKSSKFDPNGSYVGNSTDKKYNIPLQDQDDL